MPLFPPCFYTSPLTLRNRTRSLALRQKNILCHTVSPPANHSRSTSASSKQLPLPAMHASPPAYPLTVSHVLGTAGTTPSRPLQRACQHGWLTTQPLTYRAHGHPCTLLDVEPLWHPASRPGHSQSMHYARCKTTLAMKRTKCFSCPWPPPPAARSRPPPAPGPSASSGCRPGQGATRGGGGVKLDTAGRSVDEAQNGSGAA